MTGARSDIRRRAVILLFAALAIRGLALWASHDAILVKDERAYMRRAVDLLNGQGYTGSYQSFVRHTDAYKIAELPQYPGAYQPPGYTSFIAGIIAVTGRSAVAVKAVQVVIGSLTVVLLYFLALSWFGESAAWWTGWIAALYPNLIAYTHLLWSETLFMALLYGLLLVLTRRGEAPGWRTFALAGGLFGLAALTRATIVYFAPVLVAWLLWVHRDHWRRIAMGSLLLIGVAALLIAPWSIRNYRVHGGFVLIDTNAPYNLWRGNHPTSFTRRLEPLVPRYEWPFHNLPIHPVARQVAPVLVNEVIMTTGNMSPTDLEITQYAAKLATDSILDEPGLFLRRIRFRMIDMWNPTSYMIRHFRLGAYGDVSPWVKNSTTIAAVVTYLGVIAFGLVGFGLSWRDPRTWLMVLMVGFFTGVGIVAFGLTRFRLPIMPLFMLGAGHAIAVVAARRARRSAATSA